MTPLDSETSGVIYKERGETVIYLIKFNENGRRGETYVVEEKTAEQVQTLIDDGFELVPDEDYQLLIGNVDGKEYIRNADGEYIEYEPPAPTIEELKAAKIAELKTARDTLEVEPIEYNGNLFDYDEKARDRINAAIIALDLIGEGASLSWTTADNTEAIVTASDLRGVIAAVAIRSNELHVKYRELKAAAEDATTKEELEAIVFE